MTVSQILGMFFFENHDQVWDATRDDVIIDGSGQRTSENNQNWNFKSSQPAAPEI